MDDDQDEVAMKMGPYWAHDDLAHLLKYWMQLLYEWICTKPGPKSANKWKYFTDPMMEDNIMII